MMKKLILFFILSLFATWSYTQVIISGSGSIPDTLIGDNTLDAALDTMAPKASPTFTGTITIGDAEIDEVELEILDGATLSTTELNYVDGVTSSIQTQLDDTVAAADEVFMLADSNAIGGATTWSAYLDEPTNSNYMKGLNEFGASIKAMPLIISSSNALTMSDQRAYYVLFYLAKATIITGIKTTLSTAGNYDHDNYNGAALYSISGTDLTRVALSKNSVAEPNIWETTADNLITIAFDSTGAYSATAGLYMVGIVYSSSAQTTAPIIYSSKIPIVNLLLSDSKKTAGYVNSQTILPATEVFGDIVSYENNPQMILY